MGAMTGTGWALSIALGRAPDFVMLAFITGVSLVPRAIWLITSAIFTALQRVGVSAVLSAVASLSNVAFSLIALFAGFGLPGVLIGSAIGQLLPMVVALVLLPICSSARRRAYTARSGGDGAFSDAICRARVARNRLLSRRSTAADDSYRFRGGRRLPGGIQAARVGDRPSGGHEFRCLSSHLSLPRPQPRARRTRISASARRDARRRTATLGPASSSPPRSSISSTGGPTARRLPWWRSLLAPSC